MPSLTVENYVKTIFQIGQTGDGQAATGQLATALGVSPGTVTSMLKTLSEGGLVPYTPYEGVRLTPAGKALALRVGLSVTLFVILMTGYYFGFITSRL